MFNFLKTSALAALIGLGAIGATASSAQAETIRFGVGNGHFSVQLGGHHGPRHPGFRRGPGPRAFCTPARAVAKAERMGLRRARVVNVNRNVIKVRGRAWGGPQRVVFARAPHCPVIR